VQTRFGAKYMRDLSTDDEVLSPTQAGQFSWQPVTWFIHRDHNVETDFVELKSGSGNEPLALTRHHLIPVLPCDFDVSAFEGEAASSLMSKFAIFAEKAEKGQCLVHLRGDSIALEPITAKRIVRKQGIYSPMTSSGSLVVNGVHVACYSSSMESFVLQHTFYTHWYKLAKLFDHLKSFQFWGSITNNQIDVPWSIDVLASFWNSGH